MSYLLDTNIATAMLKQDERLNSKLIQVRIRKQQLYISCMTYYEVKGGLLAVNATRKLSIFEQLCIDRFQILFLSNLEIINRASEIYAELRRSGRLIQTADILIAATAAAAGLILVSHDSDMLRVSGVTVEDWLQIE
ncbi:MAG: PIN domain-containing protein [Hormoscilla sp. GUM202]|nr:PIN domain-containing protein [Hormoscilla sp. GM7CHS1pb]MBO1350473.1 PIN domain-containing protein [Hormoscilla sp. GUM202]